MIPYRATAVQDLNKRWVQYSGVESGTGDSHHEMIQLEQSKDTSQPPFPSPAQGVWMYPAFIFGVAEALK